MKHENKEVREQPQWVLDILNRLNNLEGNVSYLEGKISHLERLSEEVNYPEHPEYGKIWAL